MVPKGCELQEETIMTTEQEKKGTWTIGPRVLPPPDGASEQLRKHLAGSSQPVPRPSMDPKAMMEFIASADSQRAAGTEKMAKAFKVGIEPDTIAGVPVFRLTPSEIAPEHSEHLFVHLHGGAFVLGAGEGAAAEAVAITHFCKIPSGLGRLPAGAHPRPAAMDDALAVGAS